MRATGEHARIARLSRLAGELSCDAQFELATRIAANVGYVLVSEPRVDDIPLSGDGWESPYDPESIVAAVRAIAAQNKALRAKLVNSAIAERTT